MNLTVAEIRASLSVDRRIEEKDIWYIRYILRPCAAILALLFIKLRVNAKQTTVIGLLIGLSGCIQIATWNATLGCILLIFGSLLDYVDGTIARATKVLSKQGTYLDSVSDNIMGTAVPVAVGIGFGMPIWGLVLGMLYLYSTLTIIEGRYQFGDDEIYRTEKLNLFRLAFILGTNIQAMYLILLLVAVLLGVVNYYLYLFITLTSCEIIVVIAKRLQSARGL